MSYLMTATEFAAKAETIGRSYKTLYATGAFGAPLNTKNKDRYSNNYPQNKKREAMYKAASADTFVFDCVGLVKAILWGWSGDKNKTYGGATYASNGVPDTNETGMINSYCKEVSTDFSKIEVGEFLWMNGHCGIYIGNGLAAESTSAWDCKVQISAVSNIGSKSGYHSRKWTKHGKLPWVNYSVSTPTVTPASSAKTTTAEIKFVDLPTLTYDEKVKKITSRGTAVKLVQGLVGVTADGEYGPKTKEAVIKFQKSNGLTQDGVVGKNTWNKIGEISK